MRHRVRKIVIERHLLISFMLQDFYTNSTPSSPPQPRMASDSAHRCGLCTTAHANEYHRLVDEAWFI